MEDSIPSLLGVGEAAVHMKKVEVLVFLNLFAEWHFILRVNIVFAYNKRNSVDFTDRGDFRLLLKKSKFF